MTADTEAPNFVSCAYCRGPVRTISGPKCESCEVPIHRDCWIDFGGCPSFACANSPDMQTKSGQPAK